LWNVAIHLISGDLDVAIGPVLARSFEQSLHAQYVSLDERSGIENTPVHMRLRGEIHYDAWPVVSEYAIDESAVRDVSAHESVIGVRNDICKVFRVARVSHLVQIDDADFRSLAE